MISLIINAYFNLLQFEAYLVRGDFAGFYDRVRTYPVTAAIRQHNSIEVACSAAEKACLWYWKEVLCLQRSAATACLLRRLGIEGRLVIGTQQIPFKAHAWVEVDGCAVNDKPDMRDRYAVLDIC